jgi:hypothetical protein
LHDNVDDVRRVRGAPCEHVLEGRDALEHVTSMP